MTTYYDIHTHITADKKGSGLDSCEKFFTIQGHSPIQDNFPIADQKFDNLHGFNGELNLEFEKDRDIYSIYNKRAGVDDYICTFPYSYGMHPYDVGKINYREIDFTSIIKDNNLKAIGEIGLDFRFQETVKEQINILKYQLDIASDNEIPVILHIVKALPQALAIIEKSNLKTPFIIHGFRGGVSQAKEIISKGGFISISPKYPKDIKELFRLHKDYILFETDETGENIYNHYKLMSSISGIKLPELVELIKDNIEKSGITL